MTAATVDSAVPAKAANGTLGLLLEMELPIMVRFGRTKMPLRDLLGVAAGSIVEFGRAAENSVELLVNGRVVARGTAVVIRGNYGIRITEVSAARERLRAGRGALGGTSN